MIEFSAANLAGHDDLVEDQVDLLALRDGEVLEICPICNNEDTKIPPCAWCGGSGLVPHECPEQE